MWIVEDTRPHFHFTLPRPGTADRKAKVANRQSAEPLRRQVRQGYRFMSLGCLAHWQQVVVDVNRFFQVDNHPTRCYNKASAILPSWGEGSEKRALPQNSPPNGQDATNLT
jgi:hypothetical protein